MPDTTRADTGPERELRELLDAMEDGACIIEPITDETGRVVDLRYRNANRAFEHQSGIAAVEGRTASEAVPGLERHWFDHVEHVCKSGEPRRFVESAASLGRSFETLFRPIGLPSARRVACIFRDVTERLQTERRLRELADELSESDRRRTAFLSTLAHELRNPLAPIRTGLELVGESVDDVSEIRRLRDMMMRQVEQLVHLVDDLLDASRLSQDALELRAGRALLAELIDDAIEAARPLVETAAHELELELPDQDVWLDVDPVRVVQIVSNLLDNAARYTPPAGCIRLTVRVGAASGVRLSVSDDGEGLDESSLERVFEMFARLDGPTPRESGGLGIGLTLSRRLAELHGGTLTASSEGPGRGSRFELRLPPELTAADGGKAPARPPAETASTTSAVRVLVVDDNRDAADALAKLLRLRGHEATAVYDGRAALAKALADPPDVLFLDIGLPDISGYRVATELAGHDARERMTLIALSGWGAPSDRARSREAGFEHHLTKPISSGRVLELLATLGPPRAAEPTGSA